MPLEVWNFFERDPLTINMLDPLGARIEKKLGLNFEWENLFRWP
jgi:predicted cupin superfamily sugar epimerase